jgi:hypothetical protein
LRRSVAEIRDATVTSKGVLVSCLSTLRWSLLGSVSFALVVNATTTAGGDDA